MDMTPTAFVGHGNPMNTLEHNHYTESWRDLGRAIDRPRAVLAISAHWYINATAVTAMATAAHDSRLLRLSRRTVRVRIPGSWRTRRRRRDRRSREAELGRPRSRQLGPRPRHLVRARSPRSPTPTCRSSSCRSTRSSRSSTTSTSVAALAPLRDRGVLVVGQRQHRPQPRTDRTGASSGAGFDWAQRFDDAVRDVLDQ